MPEIIAGYRLDRPLSAGRWGTLHAARDALIVVGNGPAPDRFEQDARAASALSHPTLARIREQGIEAGSPYLVYEALDATTLEAILEEEKPIEPRRSLRLMVQVLQALEHAHDAGLSHGNLSPSTVLVRDGDRATVVALGLAGDSDPRADISAAGTLLATMLGPNRPARLDEVISGAVAGTGVYATARGMRRILEEVRVEIAPPDVEVDGEEPEEPTVWPIPGNRYDPTTLGKRVIVVIITISLIAGAAFLWRVRDRAEELREQRRNSPSPEATTSSGNLGAFANVSDAEKSGVRGTLTRPVRQAANDLPQVSGRLLGA